MDYVKVVKNIRCLLKDYIQKNNLKSLVLGVSGGIDSAVCAALARPVCDELGIKLIGRSIPIHTNKQDEIERARKIGSCFCHDFQEVDLTSEYLIMGNLLTGDASNLGQAYADLDTKIRRGNIKARLRMILLYDVAQSNKGMVLSTDNYTELLLGFWTLHGDVGDYGMIQQLWKTEVYDLARWIVANELRLINDPGKIIALGQCITATPTDGLGVTNSDLDQLGAPSYEEVDNILKSYIFGEKLTEYTYEELKSHAVVKRYLRTQFKRENPYNISRKDILE